MIRLSDLQRDERTCTVEFEGESAEVTYRPSAYTPEIEDQLQTAMESNRPSNGIARWLAGIVVHWEVMDENGEEIPPTFENMRRMSSTFLTTVINTITDDIQVRREDRKNSAGGSQRKGSLANARKNTR